MDKVVLLLETGSDGRLLKVNFSSIGRNGSGYFILKSQNGIMFCWGIQEGDLFRFDDRYPPTPNMFSYCKVYDWKFSYETRELKRKEAT